MRREAPGGAAHEQERDGWRPAGAFCRALPCPGGPAGPPTTKGANRFGSRVLLPGGVGQKIEDEHEDEHEDEQEREED